MGSVLKAFQIIVVGQLFVKIKGCSRQVCSGKIKGPLKTLPIMVQVQNVLDPLQPNQCQRRQIFARDDLIRCLAPADVAMLFDLVSDGRTLNELEKAQLKVMPS